MDSEILAWNIRRDVLEMLHKSHSSHIGSAFSIADIVAVLYSDFVDNESVKNDEPERTRIILSKGHAGSAVYAALYRTGIISEDVIKSYGENGSHVSCHVSCHVSGVDVSTGSLGQGIGMAAGIALAGKKAGRKYKTFVIAGDGECNEGSLWEMVLFAQHQNLNNLTLIIDRNGMQALGETSKILNIPHLEETFKSLDWNVRTVDGHNHAQLKAAFSNPTENPNKPTCIIANTVKGKGVSFMENNNLWHYRDPQGEDYDNAVIELEGQKP